MLQYSVEDDSAGFSIGIGDGRVWNAMPLAKVLRIQEDLQKTGQTTGDISDEGARELADIVARENQAALRKVRIPTEVPGMPRWKRY